MQCKHVRIVVCYTTHLSSVKINYTNCCVSCLMPDIGRRVLLLTLSLIFKKWICSSSALYLIGILKELLDSQSYNEGK